MARKIFRAYKDARRYDGWSGEVDPNLGQHEELLYTKVCSTKVDGLPKTVRSNQIGRNF